MWTLAWTLISHRGWPPAGQQGQIFCNDSQQVSALRRATLQGIGITVVSPDLTVVKVTKKEQEAGQQVSVRSAICSMFIWASQHRILKHDNLGGIWLPEDST